MYYGCYVKERMQCDHHDWCIRCERNVRCMRSEREDKIERSV